MTFFEKTKTPKSMADCVEIDATARFLSNWSKGIKNVAKVIFLIAVAISAFALTISFFYLFDDAEVSGVIALSVLGFIFSAFVLYSILIAFANLIQALACLVQNTKVTAMVAIYQSGEELPNDKQNPGATFNTPIANWLSSHNSGSEDSENPVHKGPPVCALCGKSNVPLTRERIYGAGGWGDICEECSKKLNSSN